MRIHGIQVTRRSVQLLVLLLTLATPVLARYANYLSARQYEKMQERFAGAPQGVVLVASDRLLRLATGLPPFAETVRPAERRTLLEAARSLKGSTWSFEVFGVTFTDPLAAAESVAASRSARWVLLLGALLPVLLTVLLGRVFCSWICPAGFLLELTGKLRRVLVFLELRPGRTRLWRGNKFLFLGLGLAACAVVGLPLLGYVYPPAILARETHNGITVMFDRAEGGLLGLSAAGLTLASWILLGIALVEILFGPRLWCRYLCPGGALYALLGRFRLLRVGREPTACTSCGECVRRCEMGLSPMTARTGMECDNCAECVSHCPEGALAFHLPGWRPGPREEVES